MAPEMRPAITWSNTDPVQFDKFEPIEDFMLKAWQLAHPYCITIWEIFQWSKSSQICRMSINQPLSKMAAINQYLPITKLLIISWRWYPCYIKAISMADTLCETQTIRWWCIFVMPLLWIVYFTNKFACRHTEKSRVSLFRCLILRGVVYTFTVSVEYCMWIPLLPYTLIANVPVLSFQNSCYQAVAVFHEGPHRIPCN